MSKRATTLLQEALEANGLTATKLRNLVAKHRTNGDSWNTIALAVYDTTSVSITVQTLINWFPEYNKPAAELSNTS